MATISREIFKAYDIRGIVGKTLTNEAAYLSFEDVAGNICHDGFLCDCEWKTGLF